ncbi:MAG: peptidyl-prolyl cis-trans isomerase, partial [Desulfobulbaceae bacterium]|nr:peptidyl-prolyl cis-trans isomerase [Desulfobulbaceae bacterium]
PPVSDTKLMQTAFSLKKGELSSLVETGEGYAILFVDDIRKPDVPELQSVRDRVVDDYKLAKSVELARKNAAEILQESREKKSLAQSIPSSARLQETGYIQRANIGGDTDLPAQVVQKGFDLSLKEPFPQEPFVQDDTYILYELVERKAGDKTLDEQQRQQLETQLLSSFQNTLLTAWLVNMQDRADIWINDQLLQ